MARYPRLGEEHHQLLTPREKPRPPNHSCLQLHTSITRELQSRGPEGRVLERTAQQRRIGIWRKWTRQPRRGICTGASISWKRSFPVDHPATLWCPLLQVRGLTNFTPFAQFGLAFLAAKSLAAEYLVRAILPAFVHLNPFLTRSMQFSRSFDPRF